MKTILVIYGGNSLENDISIITAIQTMKNIDSSKYKYYPIYLQNEFYLVDDELNIDSYIKKKNFKKVFISNGNIFLLKKNKYKLLSKIDCALLCTHGGVGEDGSLQGLLEIANIPYTSCDVKTSNMGMHKSLTKLFLKSINVPVLKYLSLRNIDNIDGVTQKLDYPVIVKPNSLGSSIGISIAKTNIELIDSLKTAFCLDNDVIIEPALQNFREMNVACYRKNKDIIVSEIEEPTNMNQFLSFDDKYINKDKKIERKCPANITKDLEIKIKSYAYNVYEKIRGNGIIRFDFLFDEEKQKVYLNEFNTIPGSLAFYLFTIDGMHFKDLITDVIEESINYWSKKTVQYTSPVLENYKDNFCGKKVMLSK